MRSILLAAVTLSTVALANMPPPAPKDTPAQVAPEAAPAAPAAAPTAEELTAKLDTLWKTRDSAASIKEFNDTTNAALNAFPNDYGILWRIARFRWFTADGTNGAGKKGIAKEGWSFAERAVKANPAGCEGKYYTALNIGAYSQAVGILTALGEGLESKFVDNLEAAMKVNDEFDRAGYYSAKGRYYWELPWPKRDLGKSRELLAKYVSKHPENLRGYYYAADTELKDGEPRKAKEFIEKALNGSTDYDPPEGRRIKAWAKDLSAKIDEALK